MLTFGIILSFAILLCLLAIYDVAHTRTHTALMDEVLAHGHTTSRLQQVTAELATARRLLDHAVFVSNDHTNVTPLRPEFAGTHIVTGNVVDDLEAVAHATLESDFIHYGPRDYIPSPSLPKE